MINIHEGSLQKKLLIFGHCPKVGGGVGGGLKNHKLFIKNLVLTFFNGGGGGGGGHHAKTVQP